MTRNKQKFEWLEEQEDAFINLNSSLCAAPILAYPTPGMKFTLDTDASGYGIGGVFSQEIDGKERVIAYYTVL